MEVQRMPQEHDAPIIVGRAGISHGSLPGLVTSFSWKAEGVLHWAREAQWQIGVFQLQERFRTAGARKRS